MRELTTLKTNLDISPRLRSGVWPTQRSGRKSWLSKMRNGGLENWPMAERVSRLIIGKNFCVEPMASAFIVLRRKQIPLIISYRSRSEGAMISGMLFLLVLAVIRPNANPIRFHGFLRNSAQTDSLTFGPSCLGDTVPADLAKPQTLQMIFRLLADLPDDLRIRELP